MNKGTLKQIIHTYINIYTYKHTLNIYTPISIQITLSISVVKLDNRVAELHFIIEWSGEKIKRKFFKSVSELYNSFSYVCRSFFTRNDFRLRKEVKSWFRRKPLKYLFHKELPSPRKEWLPYRDVDILEQYVEMGVLAHFFSLFF